jgi:hypothetical protein
MHDKRKTHFCDFAMCGLLGTVWVILSISCFALSLRYFLASRAIIEGSLEAGRPIESLPPTMVGEPRAIAVALGAAGVICLLMAYRRRNGKQSTAHSCERT